MNRLNPAAIFLRGYVTISEFAFLMANREKYLCAMRVGDGSLHFGFNLGHEHLYVVASEVAELQGDRSPVGMVAFRNGDNTQIAQTLVLFKQAGLAAIKYWKATMWALCGCLPKQLEGPRVALHNGSVVPSEPINTIYELIRVLDSNSLFDELEHKAQDNSYDIPDAQRDILVRLGLLFEDGSMSMAVRDVVQSCKDDFNDYRHPALLTEVPIKEEGPMSEAKIREIYIALAKLSDDDMFWLHHRVLENMTRAGRQVAVDAGLIMEDGTPTEDGRLFVTHAFDGCSVLRPIDEVVVAIAQA